MSPPSSQPFLPLALLVLLLGIPARADDEAVPNPLPVPSILERFEALPTFEVPVEEISGLAVLPGGTCARTDLLVVTDEGPYDRDRHQVEGALFRIPIQHDPQGVRCGKPLPVTLRVRFDRFDPKWPAEVSPMDLEAIAPLPGTNDLFLLTGERNPEDHTDDGANRVYVVRYPDGDASHARVIAYRRVFDLPFDGMNDRFEGVAVLPPPPSTEACRWLFYGFKERTPLAELVPPYAHGALVREKETFRLDLEGNRGYPPLLPSRYAESPEVVSQQSDACRGPDGTVWVLDRWRRQIHVTKPDDMGRLTLQAHHDLWPVVKDIPGEVNPAAPSPPGLPDRLGYGRHEAVGFDAEGRLYLGSDRGGGHPSTLTVLRPRKPKAPAPRETGN